MYYVGIDIGGMSVKCGLVNCDGVILAEKRITTELSRGQVQFAKDIADLVKEVAKEGNVDFSQIKSVGVGVPGIVDVLTGEVKYSCNLFKEGFPLKALLEERLSIPVKVANDADTAAYGECLFGAGKGARDLVLVTLGTGVGTGIVSEGKPFAGGRGMGGEGGHVYVGGNTLCSCGRVGCFETEVSASALIRKTEKAIQENPTSALAQIKAESGKVDGRTLFEGLKRKDETAQKLFVEFCERLGSGLVNFANVFRPEIILIGGGISAEGELITEPVQKYVDSFIYGGVKVARTIVKCATLGNKAGIIGAAFL